MYRMPAGPRTVTPYPGVPASPRLPELEEDILASWAAEGTFARSVEQRPGGDNEYVFYDGPPFANGLPHYGHLLTGYVKDAVPRYQTMRGRRVERRFGWDCHGLPAETEAEKELGVSGRGPITEYGIDRFNDYCRTSVLRYTREWERYVTRQARWVDFGNDYKTMDLPYMESVMWALKQLWEKGLLYEGYRVLPYCWECETPLSNFETRQDDAYRDRQDPAVTVAFELGAAGDEPARSGSGCGRPPRGPCPSNLALAVGPDIDYAVFERDGSPHRPGGRDDRPLRPGARGRRPRRHRQGRGAGRSHATGHCSTTSPEPPTPSGSWLPTSSPPRRAPGSSTWLPASARTTSWCARRPGIAVVCPVDDRARFTAEVPDFEGLQVFEANQPVIRDLRARGALVRPDSYVHSYPHCWRTDTPLVYKAVSSWFVKVTAIKERMLALNQQITWVPAHVRDGAFGKWLENARDWSISRNRFWGSPIPVWKSDDPAYPRIDVYGHSTSWSATSACALTDLHRPGIDELTRPNPDDPTGRSTMRRVTDVLDCWFESGSMPFAQVHYPFENREWFEDHFPGDFIVEYIGQTRGWFYTLHVLATALFDRPPFRTCLAHGIVLGDDGQKMSKRLRNYPDPEAMFAQHGADAMRWFLLSSPVLRGGDLIADEKGIVDAVRSALLPLWNAWYFFTLYANADGRQASDRPDRRPPGSSTATSWPRRTTWSTRSPPRMDGYDLSGACEAIESFLDALTNWYIRRSRDRFWGTGGGEAAAADTADAFDTLATVLEVLCRMAAPLLPLVTEAVWRGLTGGTVGASVHLTDWPAADTLPADPDLVAAMDRVREVCSAAHSIRKAQGPPGPPALASLTVAAPDADRLAPFVELIAEEVNVKEVELTTDVRRRGGPRADGGVQGGRPPPRAGHPAGGGRGQAGRLGAARRRPGPGR